MMETFKRSKCFGTVWNQVVCSKWSNLCSGNKSQWLRKAKYICCWQTGVLLHPTLHIQSQYCTFSIKVVSKVAASRVGRDGRNQPFLTCLITSDLPEPNRVTWSELYQSRVENAGERIECSVCWASAVSVNTTTTRFILQLL